MRLPLDAVGTAPDQPTSSRTCCRTSATRGAASGTTSGSTRRSQSHISSRFPGFASFVPHPLHRQPTVMSDPLWYKDAVIYEAHVRAFFDSNDDGIGDFAGLTRSSTTCRISASTALWLLPFYPSPLRDDGYDIADYTTSTRATARSRTSSASSTRRTGATSASSPSWSSTTRRTSTRGSSARGARRRVARARLLRLERHDQKYPGRGSSSPTPRSRTGPGTTPAQGVLLAPVLPSPAGLELRQSARSSRRCST